MIDLANRELATLYARALVAIARGDGEISPEEARRLQVQLLARCGTTIALDDLLLEGPLLSAQLRDLVVGTDSPYRAVQIDQIAFAELLVRDGLAVLFEKGHVAAGEMARLRAFAEALGLPDEDFARLTAHVAGWVSG